MYLVIGLICFIGIPHGATDHVVFKYLSADKLSLINIIIKFYLFYIVAILAYSLFWYLFPSFSLIIFIVISAYHLGQSNLYYLSLPKNKILKTFIYFSWGLFVVFGPILSNSKEVIAILENILGITWIVNLDNKEYFLALIILLNSLIISALFIFKYANNKELLREALNLSVLAILFYTAPLMVSFGVYFCLWHSLGSTFDQLQLIRKSNLKFNLLDVYLQYIPLTIIALLVFITVYCFLAHFNKNLSPENLNAIIGLFFIGLAAITLPHTIIRDKLYSR